MKRKTFRISAALLALALLLTLLPAVAFAEEGTSGAATEELSVKFSSNPNKRTALPLTLTEGDQLSINGFAIETVLGPKGNPLVSVGALATAATLSEGQIQALTNEQIQALTEGTSDIQISSDGRFIYFPANPAQGADGVALAGEKDDQEGLSDQDYALLVAIRKGTNSPNHSWREVLADVVRHNLAADAYDQLSKEWGIPPETIKQLMGADNPGFSLDFWVSARNGEDAFRLKISAKPPQRETMTINGQTFTLGVNGATVGTLVPTVWQDDLTPPPYHDPSYDKVGETGATGVTPAVDLPPDGGGGIDGVPD